MGHERQEKGPRAYRANPAAFLNAPKAKGCTTPSSSVFSWGCNQVRSEHSLRSRETNMSAALLRSLSTTYL